MPRALDDPELDAKYVGDLPPPPEQIPTFEDDPFGYVKYLRVKYEAATAIMNDADSAWEKMTQKCRNRQHKDKNGTSMLGPHPHEAHSSTYVQCKCCNAGYSNEEAFEKYEYLRPPTHKRNT